MRLKWDFDIGFYYNLWVSAVHARPAPRRVLARAASSARSASCCRRCETSASCSRRPVGGFCDEGRYWRGNAGSFSFGLEFIDFVEEVGRPRTRREVLAKTGEIFNSVYVRTRELLAGREGAPAEALPLTSFMVDRRLA